MSETELTYKPRGDTMQGESRDSVMNMTNDKWKSCNDMIGRILTYLDEDEVRRSTKKAVKAEIWDFYNKLENDYDDESKFNR